MRIAAWGHLATSHLKGSAPVIVIIGVILVTIIGLLLLGGTLTLVV